MKKWLIRISVLIVLLILITMAALYEGDIPKEIVDRKYSSPASQFLVMDSGARVHYRDEGVSDAQPVVLVHGSNASLHTWEPWVAILGEKYRVISLDLPAHGLTGKTPDDDYSSAMQVQVVDAVVKHLGVENFVLGGNSMGGGVTWRYTVAHPDKVHGMILVDASGLPQWSKELSKKRSAESSGDTPLAFRLLQQPWFRAIARHMDPYSLTKQGLMAVFTDKSLVTEEMVQRYYELALREGSREATMARFSGRSGRSRNSTEEIDLSQYQQPTLILWGRDDSLISVDVAEKFDTELPNSKLIIYDNVGHIPMEEVADQSAADVMTFLASLSDETTTTQSDIEAEESGS